MAFGKSCLKFTLFVFNGLFFLAGLVLVIGSAVIYSKTSGVTGEDSLKMVAIFVIVVGCLVTVISFFGCLGAVKENKCMLITFAVIMSVIFVLLIACVIAVFVTRKHNAEYVSKGLDVAMDDYGDDTAPKGLSDAMDLIQKLLKCCGKTNYTDWDDHPEVKKNSVPDSCCINETKNCGNNAFPTVKKDHIYETGCEEKLNVLIDETELGVGLFVALVAILVLCGVIFAVYLTSQIGKNYEQMK